MKRDPSDFRQSDADGGEVRVWLKHQTLSQEFLELHKEFVSKKRKLQNVNEKKDVLLAEVRYEHCYSQLGMILLSFHGKTTELIRFLRGRRRYLLKYQAHQIKPAKQLLQLQNLNTERKILEMERSYNACEAEFEHPFSVLFANPETRDQRMRVVEKEHIINTFRIGKNPRSHLADLKVGKKKIPLQR